MDLRQVRKDLATVGTTAGFNSWSVHPDDPQDLPALVVGGIKSMTRLTMSGVCQFELELAFYVSAASPDDAAERLDMVLSLGEPDSFLTVLEAVSAQRDNPAWRSARFVGAGPYQRVTMPGGGAAMSVTVTLELTA